MIRVAILALFASTVGAYGYFDTGNDMRGRCYKSESWGAICSSAASAYLDLMMAEGYKCRADGVSREQLRDVMLKYINDTPDERHLPAAFIAILSFEKSFGCRKSPAKTGQ